MMTSEQISEFKVLYEEYKESKAYSARKNQKVITEPFREIIWETLKNEPLSKVHLTGLIQMFGWRCKPDNFNKYLDLCVSNETKRSLIRDKVVAIGEKGLTNIGKTAVTHISPAQVGKVKEFLLKAFEVKTVKEAIQFCKSFEQQQIPEVRQGIYSPWLFYINPRLFPLVNNSHKNFKKWHGFPEAYSDCIEGYHILNQAIGEPDLANLDDIAHRFTKDGRIRYLKYLDLDGNRIYKLSHGIFRKQFGSTGIREYLKEKNWICMHENTGRSQGEAFKNKMKIGDFVYVCNGGDELSIIGKVTSETKRLPIHLLRKMNQENETWLYREIEPLIEPSESNLDPVLKQHRFAYMPSGNTTFAEIPYAELDYVNNEIFYPYYWAWFNDSSKENDESQTEVERIAENEENSYMIMKNLILYGPPGTGKTYQSISHSVSIIENTPLKKILEEEREEVKLRYNQYVEDRQIVFCTFHQSMSYEDFIEGIKPIEPESEEESLSYAVEDGIFKKLCTEAAFSYVPLRITQETEKVLDFSSAYDRFVDSVNDKFARGEKVEIETRNGGKILIESISSKNNISVRHIDGNRKYTVSKKRLSKISHAYPDLNVLTNINNQFRAEIGGSNSSAYWAVLHAIRNHSPEDTFQSLKSFSEKDYSYEDQKEIISIMEESDFQTNNPKNYVLIIDEINRGNVSQIFGELITLIEEDKRLGMTEALRTKLPYSKEYFGVPPNLSIIGTMNTADRSVEALDTALRRRFSFAPMMPNESLLEDTLDGISLSKVLMTLNTRLRVLKDNDHTIGHAWFWNISDIDALRIVFRDKIFPLLQEYFFNDYEKLGLVLGDTFFKPHRQISSNLFATFTGGNGLAGQYDQTWQYQLKSADELTIADFKSLEQLKYQPALDEA
jgi:hypothetical protein